MAGLTFVCEASKSNLLYIVYHILLGVVSTVTEDLHETLVGYHTANDVSDSCLIA